MRRAAVITSPSLVRQERVLSRLCGYLGDCWIGTFAEVKPHSPIEVVRSALAAVRDWEADTVVSLGGGSSVDTAKGVVWYFDEQASSPPITHIAVPSTLSGVEFTHVPASPSPKASGCIAIREWCRPG